MSRNAYQVTVLAAAFLPLMGCGPRGGPTAGSTEAGVGRREERPLKTVEAEKKGEESVYGPKGMDPQDLRHYKKSFAVLRTFLRLRDGVPPNSNAHQSRDFLAQYDLSLSQAADANIAIAKRGPSDCQRFVRVYNEIGRQLSSYFHALLADPPPELTRQQLLVARLRILQFFERTFFGMVLIRAEGGQSAIDQSRKRTCGGKDREVWTALLLRNHQDLEQLTISALGEPSAMSLADEVEDLRKINHEYGRDTMLMKGVWMAGEVVASIVLWDQAVGPMLRALVNLASITPTGRFIRLTTGTLYVAAWVAFDRQMRTMLPFLAAEPRILDQTSISGWERVLRLGEEFLVAELTNPPLYFAYLELMSATRKDAALEYLNLNSEILESAERDYGSIENALEKLKEVLSHEQPDSQDDADRPYDSERNDKGGTGAGQGHARPIAG